MKDKDMDRDEDYGFGPPRSEQDRLLDEALKQRLADRPSPEQQECMFGDCSACDRYVDRRGDGL